MPVIRQTYTYFDAKGHTGVLSMYINGDTDAHARASALAIMQTIRSMVNCNDPISSGAYNSPPVKPTYGYEGQYGLIEDKTVLTFQTATGTLHRYEIPCVDIGYYLPDQETVKVPDEGGDFNQAILASLVSFMVGHVCSRDGVLLSSYVGGIYHRRTIRRRMNIRTLNPSLTGPAE